MAPDRMVRGTMNLQDSSEQGHVGSHVRLRCTFPCLFHSLSADRG
jgi:hypothetical protein